MWKIAVVVALSGCSLEGALTVDPPDEGAADVVQASFFLNPVDTPPPEPPPACPTPEPQACPPPPACPTTPVVPAVPSPPAVPPPPVVPTPPVVPVLPPPSSGSSPPSCQATPDLAACGPGIAAVAGRPFPTIQAAIDSGVSVVSVCPGTWDATLTLEDATLRSASGSPADTVLTGSGTHPILEGESVRLIGLRFTAGRSSYAGGAITLEGSSSIACSVFDDNYADYEGGAVQARGDLTITNTHFLRNEADYEGGALSWGERPDRRLSIEGSLFVGNTAGYSGQAVEVGSWGYDTVSIVSSAFRGNTGSRGVVNFGSWGGFDGVVDRCTFDETSVALELGGNLRDGHTLSVTGTTFTGPSGTW